MLKYVFYIFIYFFFKACVIYALATNLDTHSNALVIDDVYYVYHFHCTRVFFFNILTNIFM